MSSNAIATASTNRIRNPERERRRTYERQRSYARTHTLSLFSRPVSDGRVADVVHEGTRALPPPSSSFLASSDSHGDEKAGAGGARRPAVAEATLTGTLNGKPLWLKRRKGSRVNQLFLKHDGKDLTRQIAK